MINFSGRKRRKSLGFLTVIEEYVRSHNQRFRRYSSQRRVGGWRRHNRRGYVIVALAWVNQLGIGIAQSGSEIHIRHLVETAARFDGCPGLKRGWRGW
jgi:hypothetical protein